ncbi:MAG: hypothetical protein QM813_19755 [Verrucomicrobiota bacterium]
MMAAGLNLAGLSDCPGALLFSDNFNYSVSTSLGGQGGWVNANTGDQVAVVAGNLGVRGLAGASGNRVSFGGAGLDPYQSFALTSSSVYYSFAFQIAELGDLNNTGGYIAGFGTSSFVSTLWVRKNGVGFDIGIGRTSAATSVSWSAGYALNDMVFVVGSYQVNAGVANDLSRLWINPSASSFGAGVAPVASLTTSPSSSDLSSIARFFLRQDSAAGTPNKLYLDELRIGTSWADVTPIGAAVPEPSTYLAGLLLGLPFGVRGVRYLRSRKRA